MAGMFDDLIPSKPAGASGAAPSPQAGMFDDLIPGGARTEPDGAPLGLRNVPTATSDPVYHGAVPIQQAPDQGATTAFASGVQGAPIIGPAIESGVQKAAAGVRALAHGTQYGDELQRVQEMTDIARQQYPAAAFAGDLTGAVTAMAPVVAAAPGAFGASGGGLTAGQVAVGGLSGGALGATDGAVRSGGDIESAKVGAIGGAVGGALGPVIGAAAARIGTSAADFAARAAALRNLGMSRPAAEIITRAAEADGALGGQGAANIVAAGPNGMLADAGPGVANVLDTALQRGGPGAVAARQAIESRAAGADQDLTAVLDRSLGAPQGIQSTTNAIRDGSAAARQSAYDAAYAAPIDYSTDAGRGLEDLVRNRVPPGIIARANAQMRMDGTPSNQIMARVQPDGTVVFEQMPDVRQIDYITRSLNDVSRAGDGQGALGGNTSEGRSYGMLAQQLRAGLRGAVPEYGAALDTAAQPIQARNALDFGSEMLRPSVARDVVADTIGGMTAPELAQARQGVRSQIAETMANVQRSISDPNVDARQALAMVKQFSSDATQQKLGLLLGPAEQQDMQNALTRASRALELRSSVAMNSRTFARTATNDAVKQAAAPGVLERLLAGEPLQAGKSVSQFAFAQRPSDVASRENAIYGELANALTGPRGPAASSMLDRLIAANNTRASAASIAGSIPYGGVTQTGILSLLPVLNQRAK